METIKLDLIPGKKMPSLHASQYDDGRDYHIDLTENRVPYVLDGTETISLTVRKCDNTLVTMDIANTFADKSYIEFRTTEQMNACAGFNYGEITIEKNGTQISSLNFYLQVEGAPDEGGITSQSEINNLARQVHDIVVEELEDNGASETGYDNTESGLEATNVQDAIDELASATPEDVYTKEETNETFATKTALQTVANAVSGKADANAVTQALSLKANTSYVDEQLSLKANASDVPSPEEIRTIRTDLADFVYDEQPALTWTSGKYIQPNGKIGNSATFSVSGVIDLANAEWITFNMTKSATQYVAPLGFYKSNPLINNYLVGNIIGVSNFTADVPMKVPNGANYCMVGIATADTSNFKVTIKKSAKTIELDNLANKNRVGVVFGDSIIEGVGVLFTTGGVPDCDVVSNMKRQTGATIYNGGIGGTTMADGGNPCFCDIVDAIIGGDWSSIDAYINNLISGNVAFSGLTTTIGQIKALDFNKVDYIILAYGTNDWGANLPMGDDTSTNKGEFIGAMKYCISTLLAEYPHLQFYVVAPAYRYDTGNAPEDTHMGKTLKEYSQAIEDECALLSYPCLNLYTKGAVNEYNRGYVLSSDKVHRTLIGYEILARQFSELIRQ